MRIWPDRRTALAAPLLLVLGAALGVASARTPAAAAPAAQEAPAPSRDEVYRDMEAMFGGVPSFFRLVPDNSLALEWQLFKTVQFEPGPVPNKYRELIGLAVSAATRCQYCIVYHTEVAKLHGATDAEIEDAVHYAKSSMGWSTYLNGMQVDLAQFREEVRGAVDFARQQAAKAAAGGGR